MASASLVLAAQTNGRASKGPTTPEGKRRSSANSRRHGLFSQSLQTDEECCRLSGKLRESFQTEFRPAGDFEERQVATMAVSNARYLWAVRVQAALLTQEMEAGTEDGTPEYRAHAAWQRVSAAMDRLLRLQSRFDRDYHRALGLLRKSQKMHERTESAQCTVAKNEKCTNEPNRRDALAGGNEKCTNEPNLQDSLAANQKTKERTGSVARRAPDPANTPDGVTPLPIIKTSPAIPFRGRSPFY